MNCPECGKPSMVIDSRAAAHNTIRRRRECFNGHRFTSTEIVGDPRRVFARLDALTKATEALRTAAGKLLGHDE